MARCIEPVCRLCRREGLKLFLKGERCYTDKCAIERRSYAPGQHGQVFKKKPTIYGIGLREKQKVKRIYGTLERQFRRCYKLAKKSPEVTGETLLAILERRMDNVVYKIGFASSRQDARQLIRHNHFLVNGKRVGIPSYLLKEGDVLSVKEKSRSVERIKNAMAASSERGLPAWLKREKDKYEGTFTACPTRDQITIPINEQLIIELYSK